MRTDPPLFKRLLTAFMLLATAAAFSQGRLSKQSREFNRLVTEANVAFTLPEGFKEVLPVDNDELSYDYGIAYPGHSFEIWFAVKPYRQVSRYYANPDSAYAVIAKTQVSVISGDNAYFARNLTPRILNQYNADAGKSYLLNLSDSPITRHYKYALIITFQKDHVGTILAVCLTNDKGTDFFKYLDKARNCIKFK